MHDGSQDPDITAVGKDAQAFGRKPLKLIQVELGNRPKWHYLDADVERWSVPDEWRKSDQCQ